MNNFKSIQKILALLLRLALNPYQDKNQINEGPVEVVIRVGPRPDQVAKKANPRNWSTGIQPVLWIISNKVLQILFMLHQIILPRRKIKDLLQVHQGLAMIMLKVLWTFPNRTGMMMEKTVLSWSMSLNLKSSTGPEPLLWPPCPKGACPTLPNSFKASGVKCHMATYHFLFLLQDWELTMPEPVVKAVVPLIMILNVMTGNVDFSWK